MIYCLFFEFLRHFITFLILSFILSRTLNHADFKIHVNALKAVKMESHMKMLDFASMLWREVTEATYDFRRHHRECEHLNFLTLSKVRNQFDNRQNVKVIKNTSRCVNSTERTSTRRELIGGSSPSLSLRIPPSIQYRCRIRERKVKRGKSIGDKNDQ